MAEPNDYGGCKEGYIFLSARFTRLINFANHEQHDERGGPIMLHPTLKIMMKGSNELRVGEGGRGHKQ